MKSHILNKFIVAWHQKLFIVVLCVCLFFGCKKIPQNKDNNIAGNVSITGHTMGTTYRVSLIPPSDQKLTDIKTAPELKIAPELKTEIDQCLIKINKTMSVFDPQSDISKFNALKKNKPMKLSDDLFTVLEASEKLYNLTEGAWDGTVSPLIALWGFGHKEKKKTIPSAEEIETHLKKTGFNHLRLNPVHKSLVKIKNDISLNLGSIAKGYGVDAISRLIRKQGIDDFLVEIGGEIYVSGYKNKGSGSAQGEKWRIGINTPLKETQNADLFGVIGLTDKGIATSGDYRQFFEENEKSYTHIINPVTGYPVDNRVAAVTVIAETTMMADGLATALMVMGKDKGLALIESLTDTEAMVIIRKQHQNNTNRFKSYVTSGWKQYEPK